MILKTSYKHLYTHRYPLCIFQFFVVLHCLNLLSFTFEIILIFFHKWDCLIIHYHFWSLILLIWTVFMSVHIEVSFSPYLTVFHCVLYHNYPLLMTVPFISYFKQLLKELKLCLCIVNKIQLNRRAEKRKWKRLSTPATILQK